MTFIDLGANLGIYSLVAASLTGKNGNVVAIEPSLREYSRLVKNIKLNHLSHIQTINIGIAGKRSQKVPFKIAASNHAGHNTLGNFAYTDVKLSKIQLINLDTVDNLVKKQKLQKVDLIKMDIEGSELAALYGTKNTLMRFKPVLLLELSDNTLKHQKTTCIEIQKYLKSLSYRILYLDKNTGLLTKKAKLVRAYNENVIAVPNDRTGQIL